MANVIVVDDELVVLDLVTLLIEKLGHRVWRVGTAAEVLGLLEGAGHFDLVILDLVLRGMSGIELAKRIQARYPSLPMIAMSGYIADGSTDTVKTLDEIGITEILRKPFDPLMLGAAIREALRSGRSAIT
jgi:two-component system response regulator HydG